MLRIQQLAQRLGIQGCRHRQQAQVLAQPGAHIQAQRQAQVGLQIALVEFIEDHQADAFECRIVLQAAGEDALGDHLDARVRADLAIESHLVTNQAAGLIPGQLRQAMRRHARGRATRLEHEDFLPSQPGLLEQRQRHNAGLARAGWCGEDSVPLCQRVAQHRQRVDHGQSRKLHVQARCAAPR